MRKAQHSVTHCQEGSGDIHDCIIRMQIDHAGRQYIEEIEKCEGWIYKHGSRAL